MTIGAVAKMLAGEHISNDAGTLRVYWAPHPSEIRLVEITTSVEDRDELLPFRFAADPPEVPYESVVVLLSPGDWNRVRARQLDVPDGFDRLELIAEVDGGLAA